MAKVWFITGADRGMGAAIAAAALGAGEKVAATGLDPNEIARNLGSSPDLLTARLDVTLADEVEAAVSAATRYFGRIDVVVNNAGYALQGALEECSWPKVERQIDVNLYGAIRVLQAVLPLLRAQRSGHIINFSSIAGLIGAAGGSIYCASKFAVEGLSEALLQEVSPLGIRVTIVEPGFFRTDFVKRGSMDYPAESIADYDATAGERRRRIAALDGQQPNDPNKLAAALLTLADLDVPPLRFTAGADAVAAYRDSLGRKAAELEAWRALSESLAVDADAEVS
jgi:NAD(P)-dependent dehydrogenase (short-subunit alcohol dehydrogenase family)